MTATSDAPISSCRSHKDVCRDKIARLLEAFPSQTKRQWFNEEAFWSLLRLRGIECNAPSRLAEAFFVRKILA